MHNWKTIERGDFKFDDKLNSFFSCSRGAFSRATATEIGDQQITITSNEKAIFNSFFSDYPRGSIGSSNEALREFRLYPTGEKIHLNVNHPKPSGNELRLYIKGGIFKPEVDSAWFVFEREGEIWLGSLDGTSFDKLLHSSVIPKMGSKLVDLTDEEFVASLDLPEAPDVQEAVIRRTKRNPQIARNVLKTAKACEIFPDLPLFTSKATGLLFLEAHHLVPMSLQSRFEFSLDVAENICALNPYSHRMLHHGLFSDIEEHLESLAAARKPLLEKLGVDVDYVKEVYGDG